MAQYTLQHRDAEVRYEASLLCEAGSVGEFDLELQVGRPCLLIRFDGQIRVYSVATRSPTILTEVQQLNSLAAELIKSYRGCSVVAIGVLQIAFENGPLVFRIGQEIIGYVYFYPESLGFRRLLSVTRQNPEAPTEVFQYYIDLPNSLLDGEHTLDSKGIEALAHYLIAAMRKGF